MQRATFHWENFYERESASEKHGKGFPTLSEETNVWNKESKDTEMELQKLPSSCSHEDVQLPDQMSFLG